MNSLDGFTVLVLIVQIIAAAGILAFWRAAKGWGFDEPWRPPGFREHENAFELPDTVTATLLVLSALLVWAGSPYGPALALVAAGMLLFLGIIDARYMQQNGLFAREHDGVAHTSIVVAVLGVAALLMARYLPA
jgi:hypothetical protein